MSHLLTTVSLKWQLLRCEHEQTKNDTNAENDFSDREDEDITPVTVSRSGRPIRVQFRLDI